jgi:hypothetical protein
LVLRYSPGGDVLSGISKVTVFKGTTDGAACLGSLFVVLILLDLIPFVFLEIFLVVYCVVFIRLLRRNGNAFSTVNDAPQAELLKDVLHIQDPSAVVVLIELCNRRGRDARRHSGRRRSQSGGDFGWSSERR